MDKRVILDPKKVGKNQVDLEEMFRGFMVNQDRAIKHLVRRILYANSLEGRLRDIKRPAGTFFYLGPTGVGKTRLVEIFAYLLFGSFDAMTKIDCSELQHSHEIARLIGSPPGYVGFDREPWLSQRRLDYWGFLKEQTDSGSSQELEALREKMNEYEDKAAEIENETQGQGKTSVEPPEELKRIRKEIRFLIGRYKKLSKRMNYRPASYPAILLFDEIEKADPALFDLLLQVHDRATLNVHGTTPDDNHEVLFHNTFIFYTSNIAQGQIRRLLRNSQIGFSSSSASEGELEGQIYKIALEQLEKRFSPEFIGRVHKENIIVFSPLNRDQIKEGLDRIIFPNFFKRFTASFPVMIAITEEARRYLVDEAFDMKSKTFGMRAMESVFTKKIEEELVGLSQKSIEEGNILPGDDILIDFQGRGLIFSVKERTSEQIRGTGLIKSRFLEPSHDTDGRRVRSIFKIRKP